MERFLWDHRALDSGVAWGTRAPTHSSANSVAAQCKAVSLSLALSSALFGAKRPPAQAQHRPTYFNAHSVASPCSAPYLNQPNRTTDSKCV